MTFSYHSFCWLMLVWFQWMYMTFLHKSINWKVVINNGLCFRLLSMDNAVTTGPYLKRTRSFLVLKNAVSLGLNYAYTLLRRQFQKAKTSFERMNHCRWLQNDLAYWCCVLTLLLCAIDSCSTWHRNCSYYVYDFVKSTCSLFDSQGWNSLINFFCKILTIQK
jgi:hypothetical protein